jgi:hypothetical protein
MCIGYGTQGIHTKILMQEPLENDNFEDKKWGGREDNIKVVRYQVVISTSM